MRNVSKPQVLTFCAFLLASVAMMGAKGCSDCQKQQAAAAATCAAAGEESQACKDAKALAAKACEADPSPKCGEGENCGCYAKLEVTGDWRLMSCTAPQTCEAKRCMDPATCADGLPPGPDGCPKTCADLACEYGCDQPDPHKDAVCRPKPEEPPATILLDDEKLSGIGSRPSKTWAYTWEVLNAVKAKHPELFNAEQTGVPKADIPGGIEKVYAAMAVECAARGRACAQSLSDSGQRSDCIFVRDEEVAYKFEEQHLFEYGGGKHATAPKNPTNLWAYDHEEPPVEAACPAPVPPRLWTAETLPSGWGEDQIGKPRFKINAKVHNEHAELTDSTPIFLDRWNGEACGYCMAVMGEEARNRCTCPARPDGHPDRVACENTLLLPPPGKSGPKWVLDGSTVALPSCEATNTFPCVTDNPFQALKRGKMLRACSWDMAVCSDPV